MRTAARPLFSRPSHAPRCRSRGDQSRPGRSPRTRRSTALVTLFVGVALLAAGSFIAVDRPALAAESRVVVGGTIDWGVRTAFRNYIVGPIAKGSISTTGGASAVGDVFRFPVASGTADGDRTFDVRAGGSVSFKGHDHGDAGALLQLTISNLRVKADGTTATLYADVVSLPLVGDVTNPVAGATPVEYAGVELASLDLAATSPVASGDTVALANAPATLTTAGAPAFSGFYNAGEGLDPVSITLQLAGGAPPPPASPGSGGSAGAGSSPGAVNGSTGGADTGGPVARVDRASVAPGGTVTVTGDGFTPGEQVQLWMHSTPTFVAVAPAGADGVARITGTVPADLAPGSHRFELRGLSSGHSVYSAPVAIGDGLAQLPRTGGSARPSVGAIGIGLVAVGIALLATARAGRALDGSCAG